MSNLEERTKIDYLKEALGAAFKPYGPIVEIVAKSSLKRKGQAFIVFSDENSAQEAIEMDGFELFGKPIKVALAKSHSDETVKRKAGDMFDEHKRKRLMLKGKVFTLTPHCRTQANIFAQISNAQKKMQRHKLTLQLPPKSLALPKLALPSSLMNTLGQTRLCSFRTFLAMSTKTTLQPYSSDSKASRKSAWYQSDLWPLLSSRTSNLRSQQRRQQQTPLSVQKASQ